MALDDIPITAPDTTGTVADLRGSTQPERAASIKDAWQATIEATGPITFDEKQSGADAAEPAEAEAHAEPEKPAEKKPAKAAAKAKEPEPEAEPEKKPDEDLTVRGLIKARQDLRDREERRIAAHKSEREALHRDVAAHYAKIEAQNKRFAPLVRVAEAIDSGDFDEIAKGLGEFSGNGDVKSWNDLNTEALKALQAGGQYKQIRETRRQLAAMKEEQEQREAAAAQQRQAVEQEQAARAWKQNIVVSLGDDEDAAIQEIADTRPQFADLVMDVQRQHWHSHGEELSARQAAEKALDMVRGEYEAWSALIEKHPDSFVAKKLMGSRAAPKQPAVTDGNRKAATSERRAAPAAKTVSHTRGASAAPSLPMTGDQLIKHWTAKIEAEAQQSGGFVR